MTNSSQTVDINLNHNLLLPSNVLPLEKCNLLINRSKASQGGIERLNYQTHNSASCNRCAYSPNANDRVKCLQTGGSDNFVTQSRAFIPNYAHMQQSQTQIDLQGHRHTFRNLSGDMEMNVSDINRNSNNNSLISKECAFSLSSKLNYIDENPKDSFSRMRLLNCNDLELERVKSIPGMDGMQHSSDRRISPLNRTEYQENAFLHIEDVHNYAKVNRYSSYSNETSNSSLQDDDNDDEEEIEEVGNLEEEIDSPGNYECYLKNRNTFHTKTSVDKFNGDIEVAMLEKGSIKDDMEVNTVQKTDDELEHKSMATPEHHARRPMNAFLIFCKRHRAIVKDRYKSLENRAITKILGDWWASLDANDKKCFTNLAQQNKDAFFTANPNFKWYKLPAPPLRTLNTRPSNNGRSIGQDEGTWHIPIQSNNCAIPNNNNHYFKLADEAQMGELSMLINGETNNNNTTENALQQALSETTHFFNSYMPQSVESNTSKSATATTVKRRLHGKNSQSDNVSEDDTLPRKLSRSCKGKIYQELINSGQISAVTKKMKATRQQNYSNINVYQDSIQPTSVLPSGESVINLTQDNNSKAHQYNGKQIESSFTEGSQTNFELTNFDLEEKIKELPALSLDLYLQRKRSTKKKKKFTSKKRNTNSASSSKSSPTPAPAMEATFELPTPQAVGSQKRKARKESITRRNISAIEEEIASVIPMTNSFSTINGCYFFNVSPDSTEMKTIQPGQTIPKETTDKIETGGRDANVFGTYNDNTSSTSDLFILAEVAANRTELNK